MNVSVVIATCGSADWADLAWSFAYPSAVAQRDTYCSAAEIVIEHHAELSVAQARNAAATQASNEWLCFLDADDELAPGYLAAMERAWADRVLKAVGDVVTASGPRTVMKAELIAPTLLVPNVQYVYDGDEQAAVCLRREGVPLHDLNWAVIGSLVPRWLFEVAGGFPDEAVYEDWALWLACHYDHGAELVSVPDAVYRAHMRPDGRNVSSDRAGEVYERYRGRYARQ